VGNLTGLGGLCDLSLVVPHGRARPPRVYELPLLRPFDIEAAFEAEIISQEQVSQDPPVEHMADCQIKHHDFLIDHQQREVVTDGIYR
jgi:hypothetical protein